MHFYGVSAIRSDHHGAFVLAMPTFFSSLVWHLAGMCFVQVGRFEQYCCCLRGLFCDGSEINDACFLFFFRFFCLGQSPTLLFFFFFFFWVGELFITMTAMKVTTRAAFSSSDDEQLAT